MINVWGFLNGIVMNELIEFNQKIVDIILENKLDDLHYFKIKEAENVPSFFIGAVRRKQSLRSNFFQDFKFYDDLYFITRDLSYVTGMLYYLQPFINDPVQERGTYFKSVPDSRYMMYVNFAHQLVYNYWDRIGDLLHEYFETGASSDKIYLGRILNNFPEPIKKSEYFIWLDTVFKREIKPLFKSRDDIVHFRHIETDIFYQVMSESQNIDAQKNIRDLKNGYPSKFKEILNLSCQALINATKLISEHANHRRLLEMN